MRTRSGCRLRDYRVGESHESRLGSDLSSGQGEGVRGGAPSSPSVGLGLGLVWGLRTQLRGGIRSSRGWREGWEPTSLCVHLLWSGCGIIGATIELGILGSYRREGIVAGVCRVVH